MPARRNAVPAGNACKDTIACRAQRRHTSSAHSQNGRRELASSGISGLLRLRVTAGAAAGITAGGAAIGAVGAAADGAVWHVSGGGAVGGSARASTSMGAAASASSSSSTTTSAGFAAAAAEAGRGGRGPGREADAAGCSDPARRNLSSGPDAAAGVSAAAAGVAACCAADAGLPAPALHKYNSQIVGRAYL